MGGNVPIRNPPGHPDRPPFVRPLADHVHDPHFIGVADRKRLPLTHVPVLLDQLPHNDDGFPSRLCALERDVNQGAVVHFAGTAEEFLPAAVGRLADGYLMLIHVPNNGVGLGHLLDLAQILARVPFVDVELFPFRMGGSGGVVEFSIERMGIRRVADQRGSIDSSASGKQEVCAGQDGR